jgi:hypothetical protein
MSGPAFGVPPYEPEDQVVRRERFERQHPEIEILWPRDTGGYWIARRDGQELARRSDLQWFLDDLEALVSQ